MNKILIPLLITCISHLICYSQAQITLSGTILDKETSAPLAFASIGLRSRSIGTASNSEGEFIFHFPEDFSSDTLFVAMLGYGNYKKPVKELVTEGEVTIRLRPEAIVLDEVLVEAPQLTGSELITMAFERAKDNYPNKAYNWEGFIRKTDWIEDQHVALLEAALLGYHKRYDSRSTDLQIIEIRKSLPAGKYR